MKLFSKSFDEFAEKSLNKLKYYVYQFLEYDDGINELMLGRQIAPIVLSEVPEKLSFEELIDREFVIFKHEVTFTHCILEYHPFDRDPWISHYVNLDNRFLEIIIGHCGFKTERVLEEYNSTYKQVKLIIDELNKKIEEYNIEQIKIFEEEKVKYNNGFYNARKLIDELNAKISHV